MIIWREGREGRREREGGKGKGRKREGGKEGGREEGERK